MEIFFYFKVVRYIGYTYSVQHLWNGRSCTIERQVHHKNVQECWRC